MRLFARNKQSWLSIVCIPQSINAALLCACFWVSLGSLAVREANAQGSVVLIIRILAVGGPSQTIHIWGPSATDPGLSLIGLGSNDNPSGTTPFGSASGMSLIGAGGSGGHFGYATTYASLIGALGQNQPESSLTVLSPGGVTTFRTGTALGCVQPINFKIGNWNDPWQDAAWGTFEIVAWDNSSGLYPTWQEALPAWQGGVIAAGHSAKFNVANIGGTANPAPYLNDAERLQSFNLYFIPEPSKFGLAGLGVAALIIARRRR